MSTNQPCDPRFNQMISHYIDGDLEESERQELLKHMASCEHCRATFESYRTIGTALRSLPPVNPPEQLREQIYAETVDNRYRRLRIASTRMGYSVAAVAAILAIFIVAAYLLVAGYQRSMSPEVVSSLPGEEVVWPLHRPISISFNKEMDRESVEAALSISPASEKDRLSTSWDGNTLVLGESQVLKPGSSYSISIGTDARDNWGNELDQSFALKFQTGPSVTQLETSTPEPSPTETESASNTPTVAPTDPPSETAVDPTEPREDSPSPTQTDPPPPTETPEDTEPPADPDDGAQGEGDEGNQGGPEQEEPVPTNTPEPEPSPTPTSTPTPEPPTATPSPTPTDEPPTPTPEPEDTPEEEEPEPTSTATPDTIAVNEAFGSVYWGQAEVQERLGEPEMRAVETSLQELDFQHGAMLYRVDLDTVFVVESIGVWSQIPSIDGEVRDPETGPEDGTWEPGGTIGLVWDSETWIQDSLGFALSDAPSRFTSNYQEFEEGFMVLSSSGQVYVFYNDGTWELYSDPES